MKDVTELTRQASVDLLLAIAEVVVGNSQLKAILPHT